ncbi:SET and MYND domain-containing protein 4 [Anguilla anguilla]|uniref:SET and MYND domain-containing protein 4 n=1 Tax=Anguilla anguilla TaxID=7936 RepID=UPI0015B359F2|nr:SET and MYND domain-containing protein 4 [Anguilla anguilla]
MDLPCLEWHEHVEQKWKRLSIDQKKAFSTLSEVDAIFAFGQSLLNCRDLQVLCGLSEGFQVQKNPQSAGTFRERGNLSFKARDYAAAVSHYSKGVCHAAQGGEELSLCLANRSAALFHLSLYQECLQDISRALGQGYPSHLQQKLLDRKAQCLKRLGQRAQDKEHDIDSNVKSISTEQRLPQAYGPGMVSCASPAVSLQFSPSKGRHLLAAEDIAAGDVVLEERAFSCVLIPGGSPVARPEKDRYMEVRDGGINTEDQHCHHCLRHTLSPVPCQGCSYARYCGERCQRDAWEGHHRWECPVGGELRAAGVLAHLALRVALRAGLEEVQKARGNGAHPSPVPVLEPANENVSKKEVEKEKGNEEVTHGNEMSNIPEVLQLGMGTSGGPESCNGTLIQGCDPTGRYQGNSYLCIHHLLPHLSGHEPGLRFLCAVTMATLCLRLQEVGPLPAAWGRGTLLGDERGSQSQSPEESGGGTPELSMLGATALRHMLQLRCNAQAVTMLKDKGSPGSAVQSIQEVRVATAIFPTLSMLNHSCSPNTGVSFGADPAPGRGVAVTLRATGAVGAGQELLHCYGPHYTRMPVRERQRLLQEQYFFLCQCTACCQELGSEVKVQGAAATPELHCVQCGSALQGGEDGYVCSRSSCDFQLSQADLAHRLQGLRAELDQAERLIERDRPDDALRRLQAASGQASRFLPETHPLRGELADTSARAHAATGDWRQAAAQLRRSVAAVRAQYGRESVELGRQLFKLAQLHFNGGEPQPALSVIPKARRLLSLHCSPSCEELEELQAMEDCLQGVL